MITGEAVTIAGLGKAAVSAVEAVSSTPASYVQIEDKRGYVLEEGQAMPIYPLMPGYCQADEIEMSFHTVLGGTVTAATMELYALGVNSVPRLIKSIPLNAAGKFDPIRYRPSQEPIQLFVRTLTGTAPTITLTTRLRAVNAPNLATVSAITS